jgi:hypothetical protein
MKDKGGNAVDAAIASNLCVGVLHNFASGIGGGGVMLYDATITPPFFLPIHSLSLGLVLTVCGGACCVCDDACCVQDPHE